MAPVMPPRSVVPVRTSKVAALAAMKWPQLYGRCGRSRRRAAGQRPPGQGVRQVEARRAVVRCHAEAASRRASPHARGSGSCPTNSVRNTRSTRTSSITPAPGRAKLRDPDGSGGMLRPFLPCLRCLRPVTSRVPLQQMNQIHGLLADLARHYDTCVSSGEDPHQISVWRGAFVLQRCVTGQCSPPLAPEDSDAYRPSREIKLSLHGPTTGGPARRRPGSASPTRGAR